MHLLEEKNDLMTRVWRKDLVSQQRVKTLAPPPPALCMLSIEEQPDLRSQSTEQGCQCRDTGSQANGCPQP